MKFDIFTKCPACHHMIIWILDDGISLYQCSNSFCPILFEERILYKKQCVLYYQFKIDNITVMLKKDELIINPYWSHGLPTGGEIVLKNYQTEINWEDLSSFKKKIKTLIMFS